MKWLRNREIGHQVGMERYVNHCVDHLLLSGRCRTARLFISPNQYGHHTPLVVYLATRFQHSKRWKCVMQDNTSFHLCAMVRPRAGSLAGSLAGSRANDER